MEHPVYPRPYCIRGHTIWVAAEMRAGGAFAHATVALATMTEASDTRSRDGK